MSTKSKSMKMLFGETTLVTIIAFGLAIVLYYSFSGVFARLEISKEICIILFIVKYLIFNAKIGEILYFWGETFIY